MCAQDGCAPAHTGKEDTPTRPPRVARRGISAPNRRETRGSHGTCSLSRVPMAFQHMKIVAKYLATIPGVLAALGLAAAVSGGCVGSGATATGDGGTKASPSGDDSGGGSSS